MAGPVTMATNDLTISELLETDFLKCSHCKSVYSSPRLLPCLHTFCAGCIEKIIKAGNQSETLSQKSNQSENSSQNGETESASEKQESLTGWDETLYGKNIAFSCPICKSVISLAQVNKNGFPENTFIQQLCTMFEYKQEKTRNCEYCRFDGKVVPATHLCLECRDNMCQSCTSAHHRTKITRLHKVIPYAQVKKGLYDIEVREYQAQFCGKHKDEQMDIFCEKCEMLVCKECKMQSHDNHKSSKAEKAITKYETQMKNLLGGIQQQIPTIHNYVQFLTNYDSSVERGREKCIEGINKQAELLHQLVDEQKQACLEALNEQCDKERCKVQVCTSNLRTAATSLENNETYLKLLLQHGKPDETLSLHRQINTRLTQLSHMQMEGLSLRLKAEFTSGNATAKNIQIVFGKMSILNESFTHSDTGLASQGALKITNILPNVKNDPELVMQFDATGPSDTKEIWPTGITMTHHNECTVVDRDNKIVKIFDRDGKVKKEIIGTLKDTVVIPFDVATLKNGNLIVTDHESEDAKVFTPTGEHVLTISEGIKYPRGVTVNSKGQIIILDCQHRHLTVHDPNTGNIIRTINATDTRGAKVLVDPYYVTTSPQDTIIVTDTASPHIKFFSPTGEYLANYGQYGVKSTEILQPYGICCDSYGYIFVADNQNHRIHVLMPDGKFSQFLLTKSEGLWHPMGVTITQKGHLALTEALGRVKIYKYL